MHTSNIQCNILVPDGGDLLASLRAARRAGPGAVVRTAEDIILSVTVGVDEPSQRAMLDAYNHNSAVYAEHPELLARYYQRPRQTKHARSLGPFRWLPKMGGDPRKRRAATLARERAEREQEEAA